jgi:putative toxin-antitoxin system antitoxin component (TIGR02293 family)
MKKKRKSPPYTAQPETALQASDFTASYALHPQTSQTNMINALFTSRKGMLYRHFKDILTLLPLTIKEWSECLHLSERTLLRYSQSEKPFDPIYTDRILQIQFLFQHGAAVFGTSDQFNAWMNHNSIALGGVKPKELLDTAFGIQLIDAEIGRIEHGIFS